MDTLMATVSALSVHGITTDISDSVRELSYTTNVSDMVFRKKGIANTRAGFRDFIDTNGDINSMFSFRGYIFVHQKNGDLIRINPDDETQEQVVINSNIINEDKLSPVYIDNSCYFTANDGLYKIDDPLQSAYRAGVDNHPLIEAINYEEDTTQLQSLSRSNTYRVRVVITRRDRNNRTIYSRPSNSVLTVPLEDSDENFELAVRVNTGLTQDQIDGGNYSVQIYRSIDISNQRVPSDELFLTGEQVVTTPTQVINENRSTPGQPLYTNSSTGSILRRNIRIPSGRAIREHNNRMFIASPKYRASVSLTVTSGLSINNRLELRTTANGVSHTQTITASADETDQTDPNIIPADGTNLETANDISQIINTIDGLESYVIGAPNELNPVLVIECQEYHEENSITVNTTQPNLFLENIPPTEENYFNTATDREFTNRILISQHELPEDFTEFDYVEIGDDDPIVGIEVINNSLFIFKENSIYSTTALNITTQTTFRVIDTDARLISKNAIVKLRNAIYVGTKRGILVISPNTARTYLTDQLYNEITQDLEQATTLSSMSKSAINDEIYFSLNYNTQTPSNTHLVYNVRNREFSRWIIDATDILEVGNRLFIANGSIVRVQRGQQDTNRYSDRTTTLETDQIRFIDKTNDNYIFGTDDDDLVLDVGDNVNITTSADTRQDEFVITEVIEQQGESPSRRIVTTAVTDYSTDTVEIAQDDVVTIEKPVNSIMYFRNVALGEPHTSKEGISLNINLEGDINSFFDVGFGINTAPDFISSTVKNVIGSGIRLTASAISSAYLLFPTQRKNFKNVSFLFTNKSSTDGLNISGLEVEFNRTSSHRN